MNWLILIPFVLNLVQKVETIFGEAKGQGAVKKSSVLNAVGAIVDGMVAASTGGQKETWKTVEPFVGNIIDGAVAVYNTVGWSSDTPILTDEEWEKRKIGY